MSDRQLRIEALIKKNLSEIIQFSLKNPHLGFVCIPQIKVSKDFSYAKIYVSFINVQDEEKGLEVLNHSKGFIRTELAKRMDTRRVPELTFILDEGYKKEARITSLLENDKKKTK